MRLIGLCTTPLFLAALWSLAATAADRPQPPLEQHPSARWEKQIAAFEARDQRQPPPKNGLLFVGSSSIRGWDLAQSFPGLPVINRGFGGSQIADSTYYLERIVFPHQPRVVVLYAGDNDIASGKSPQRVARDFRHFAAAIHARLPDTRIVFIAIKPSIRRWQLVGQMREANRLIRQMVDQDQERLSYVDIDAPMLGRDGKPRAELFREDGLHLNAQGYRLWASLVRPHLSAE